MHIILTHEQADFDALGSLLGAYLLQDHALPVLPTKMNRNVRAFVNLYGVELPFVDRQDLPSEPVEAITLVDTQSLISVKGAGKHTRVSVFDHHPLRSDLPDSWQITSVDLGAVTTLFVEGLQEHNGAIRPIYATLLLMGIYEDTGSLTYSRTTPRDVRAAAFLLDHGASLKVAVEFLNHPLSMKQQEIYDDLRASARTISIHGHHIIVACGDASDMDEELSTVAHKLRDLMDPDALILLIRIRSGVQLIARSTTDQIDVAALASFFGGGGHARAAAGLVKDRELDDILAELERRLGDVVRPAITVAQIMSRSPQVLTLDTPVETAEARMQRFGYEGYPVVRDGRVVGLLTRRAVDRAISHKLKLPAGSLMDAGEVTVSPEASIFVLQRLMTETGWGQIPVVEPESGKIIGIVTRTDLLKTLNMESGQKGFNNLASRLDATLSPGRLTLLKTISDEAYAQHCAVYIVGGFVRDLLLDRPSLDFDLVVEGDSIALTKALSAKYGGRVTSHSRFGTAKWFLKGKNGAPSRLPVQDVDDLPEFIDLISARTEFYTHPTALPTVERGSIKLDLHRRDFTINTLALRLDGYHYGELHDYWGGLNDLRQGLVRSLHSLSFIDDPTRMLRAVRFEQRFGFRIEERTLQLLEEAVPLIDRVSSDRIRHELDHILDEEAASRMIARLDEVGVLNAIHPALAWDEWFHKKLTALRETNIDPAWSPIEVETPRVPRDILWNGIPLHRVLAYLVWLMRLDQRTAAEAAGRLKMARSFADQALASCQLFRVLPALTQKKPSEIVQELDEFSPVARLAVYLAVDEEDQRAVLENYTYHWQNQTPSISGDDLRNLGLPPGPSYRNILTRLRSAWLDGEVRSVDEEKRLLETLLVEENGRR